MDRTQASKMLRQELDSHGLKDWSVRLTTDFNQPFLGLCSYKDKAIILNAAHVDIHPDAEVISTIKHEVAHAIVGPGYGHGQVWKDKAVEIGCDNTEPCSHLSLPDHIIDAIRSGATVEMTVEEKTYTNVVRTPKYQVTRLQEKCPECGKVAVEKFTFDTVNDKGDQVKMITLECFHVIERIIPKATPFEDLVSNWYEDHVANCKHEWPISHKEADELGLRINQCLKCKEYRLLPFQVIGARAIEAGLVMQKGFGIFDDMGLGKTVQVLAYLRYHMERAPILFEVKSALMFQWFKEINRWLGPKFVPQIIRSSKDVPLKGLKAYIISYDLLRQYPKERLDKLGLKTVVLDECQQIKNVDSGRTQQTRKIVASPDCKVIPMSGTPWYNNGGEYFPVMNMLSPMKFPSAQRFLNDHVAYYYEGNKRKQGGMKNPKKFKEFVKDICIRREFDDVMEDFPSVNRMKLNVQLDDLDQSAYNDEVSDFVAWYNEAVISGTEDSLNGIAILGKMARMRHIVGLAKIPATMGFVEEFLEETDRRLVIFVHHVDVGELLLKQIKEKYGEQVTVLSVTSEHSDHERYEIAQKFGTSKRAILIASTQASGEGLDGLQAGCDAVMHERQWNPQREDQAAPGRFKRYGQKSKAINITFIEADETIDIDLDVINSGKRLNFHEVMNESEMPKWNQDGFAKQLAIRIVAKHKELNKGKTPTKIKTMASMRG